ncbi:MAG: terminase small subunit protein [Pseudomonadota bacterium]
MARRSKYSQKYADAICARLSAGDSIRTICKDENMPTQSTVYLWLAAEPGFSEQYARARETQADCLADEILAISDESTMKATRLVDGVAQEYDVPIDAVGVARNRLRADSRKWYAGKVAPKKYGDKLAIGGAEDLPPVKLMSNDALETKIAELQAKLRGAT